MGFFKSVQNLEVTFGDKSLDGFTSGQKQSSQQMPVS